jgi:hypothetical protein
MLRILLQQIQSMARFANAMSVTKPTLHALPAKYYQSRSWRSVSAHRDFTGRVEPFNGKQSTDSARLLNAKTLIATHLPEESARHSDLVPETGIEPVRPFSGKRRILSRFSYQTATRFPYEGTRYPDLFYCFIGSGFGSKKYTSCRRYAPRPQWSV